VPSLQRGSWLTPGKGLLFTWQLPALQIQLCSTLPIHFHSFFLQVSEVMAEKTNLERLAVSLWAQIQLLNTLHSLLL